MARKSRTAGVSKEKFPVNKGAYRTGIYARLSSEESGEDALENQIFLLKSYVEQQTDMRLVETYADFGFTGTNFKRPGFERLMEDAKTGKINCIVVKDLSRLGRNYIETGNLIENIFPFLQIQFISVTDGFDTIRGDGMENMVVSIKNLVKEVYSKDISRKIITAFRTKQRNGDFIGLVAPYGYLKSKENKNKFVVDEVAAPVVQRIYKLYADGEGIDRIARALDREGVPCPRKYRYQIGVTKSDRYKDSRWERSAVKTILTNRAYIGDMVQGKVKQEFCNNLPMRHVEKADWIVAEDTHEPIIDRELFFQVQELLKKRQKELEECIARSKAKDHKEENCLKGYIQCGCCGKSFDLSQTMRNEKMIRVYYCRGYQAFRSDICTNTWRPDKAETEKVVLEEVKACLRKMLQSGLPKQEKMDADGQTEKKEIARIDRELKSIAGKLADLYQDTAEGILNDADYLLMRNEFSARKSKLEAERESLVHIVSEKKRKPKDTAVQSTLKKYLSAKKLDRTMVECFVEKVIVHEGRDIKVKILEPEEILRRMGV